MKIYLVTWPQAEEQQLVLTNVGIRNRLCSFYFFHGAREDLLPDIVETGLAEYIEEPEEPIGEIPLEILILTNQPIQIQED